MTHIFKNKINTNILKPGDTCKLTKDTQPELSAIIHWAEKNFCKVIMLEYNKFKLTPDLVSFRSFVIKEVLS